MERENVCVFSDFIFFPQSFFFPFFLLQPFFRSFRRVNKRGKFVLLLICQSKSEWDGKREKNANYTPRIFYHHFFVVVFFSPAAATSPEERASNFFPLSSRCHLSLSHSLTQDTLHAFLPPAFEAAAASATPGKR